jgi:hypothetical protein
MKLDQNILNMHHAIIRLEAQGYWGLALSMRKILQAYIEGT